MAADSPGLNRGALGKANSCQEKLLRRRSSDMGTSSRTEPAGTPATAGRTWTRDLPVAAPLERARILIRVRVHEVASGGRAGAKLVAAQLAGSMTAAAGSRAV